MYSHAPALTESPTPSSGLNQFIRWIGPITLVAIIFTDFVRIMVPQQPVVLSLAPLILCTFGSLGALGSGLLKAMAPTLKASIAALVALCVYGSLVSALRGIPGPQTAAGWLVYAGALPAILVGFAIAQVPPAERLLGKWLIALLVFSIAIAFMQQFGFLTMASALEDVPMDRGVKSLGINFVYTSGPFRTPSVFSAFLATSMAMVLRCYGYRLGTDARSQPVWITLLLLGSVAASILAARRSGLAMLAAVAAAYLLLSARKQAFKILAIVALGALTIPILMTASDIDHQIEVGAKFQHTVVETQASRRLGNAFHMEPRDLRLLSVTGDGLGSHGPAVRAGGLAARAKEDLLLNASPVIHFGWFKDLISFGPLGLILHLFYFFALFRSVTPRRRYSEQPFQSSVRLCGTALAAAAILVYFFVATSWLDGLTGGLMFGLTMGMYSGHLTLRPHHDS